MKMKIRLEFKLQDMWIGAFFKKNKEARTQDTDYEWLDIYICILPMFPIHISTTMRIIKLWDK